MSKDTIKRWILTQEQIEALLEWKEKADQIKIPYQSNWLRLNPCPLPNPVEIPSDEEIFKWADKDTSKVFTPNEVDAHWDISCNAKVKGANWMKNLIFNKQ